MASTPEPLVSPSTTDGAPPQPAGRRAQQRADTRERLFQAALDEFRACGVASAQIDRIARTAGVVRGTFYFHFPTKDAVLLELLRRVDHQARARVTALRLERPPLHEVLLRVVDAVQESVNAVRSAELVREMLSFHVRRPFETETDVLLEDTDESLADEITFHVAAAQGRGDLRSDLRPEQISVLFLTSTFGFVARLKDQELREALYSLVGVIVKGIQR